jgi:hypothetical protein
MNRKQFLKNCACGLCSCAAVGLLASTSSAADEAEPREDWRFPFIKQRYAKLFEILAKKLSDTELTETLQQLGGYCASKWQVIHKYRGDIDGYIREFKKLSGDDIVYDREKRMITVTGAERGGCFCPLVDQKLMSKKMCDCSLGWQQYAFETLLGKKVKAELTESVLRGSKRCAFQIHVSDDDV